MGCMSLVEIYRGLLAGCYIQQKSGTLPQRRAAIGIGFRVWLIQNTVLPCVQGYKLDTVLVGGSNSCSQCLQKSYAAFIIFFPGVLLSCTVLTSKEKCCLKIEENYFPAWGEIACCDSKSPTALAEAQREILLWSIIMGSFIVPKSYYCIKKEKEGRKKGRKKKGSLYIGFSLASLPPTFLPRLFLYWNRFVQRGNFVNFLIGASYSCI